MALSCFHVHAIDHKGLGSTSLSPHNTSPSSEYHPDVNPTTSDPSSSSNFSTVESRTPEVGENSNAGNTSIPPTPPVSTQSSLNSYSWSGEGTPGMTPVDSQNSALNFSFRSAHLYLSNTAAELSNSSSDVSTTGTSPDLDTQSSAYSSSRDLLSNDNITASTEYSNGSTSPSAATPGWTNDNFSERTENSGSLECLLYEGDSWNQLFSNSVDHFLFSLITGMMFTLSFVCDEFFMELSLLSLFHYSIIP